MADLVREHVGGVVGDEREDLLVAAAGVAGADPAGRDRGG
jgi:hypothetical protein